MTNAELNKKESLSTQCFECPRLYDDCDGKDVQGYAVNMKMKKGCHEL